MNDEMITSSQNPKIKRLMLLQQKSAERRKAGLFVVEGQRELQHCIDAGFDIDTVFFCPEIAQATLKEDYSIISISPSVYERVAYRGGTEGVIALVRPRVLTLGDLHLGDNPLVMVLESVEKPGNLGAVLRSADAAGVDAVIVCDPLTDLYNPNLIRSSIGAIFTVAVSFYYLLKKRDQHFAVESIKVASIVGLVASLLTAITGDHSAYTVAQVQPMKLAAMEALYNGSEGESLTAIALVNPFQQPDYASGEEPPMMIGIPKMLSFMATHDFNGFVPGVNDLSKGGFTNADGQVELSLAEKMERGKKAIAALADYRRIKTETKGQLSAAQEKDLADKAAYLKENMKYFGYGYIKDADEVVPYIPLCFYTFRIMVGLGCLFILFFAVTLFLAYKKDITAGKWWKEFPQGNIRCG